MATQRRMVWEKIFHSRQVSKLKVAERHLYIATIVMADDQGCVNVDADILKQRIFYGDKGIGPTHVAAMIDHMEELGLLLLVPHPSGRIALHPNWNRYQTHDAARRKDSEFLHLFASLSSQHPFVLATEEKISESKEANEMNQGHSDDASLLRAIDAARQHLPKPFPEDLGFILKP